MKKEPKICLKCKEILTFCSCDNTITDKDEYIEYLEKVVEHAEQHIKIFAR